MRGKIASTVLGFCLCLLPLCVQAEDTPPLSVRAYGGRFIYQQGFFRIIYTTKGEHAIPPGDVNGNGIPDFAEDVLRQLQVAHHIFCDLAGFQAPLASPRYAGARFVDAFIYNRERLKGNSGLSFQVASPAPGSDQGERSLHIHVANDIKPSANATPTHEYFHHIQNGLSHLSNRWYYEGMARWAEDAVAARTGAKRDQKMPWEMLRDTSEQNELFALSYNGAEKLWIPLANLCVGGSITLSKNDPAFDAVYTDGTPVMKDRIFSGSTLMKEVMLWFSAIEDLVFVQSDYEKWYGNQRNAKNNVYMLSGVRHSVESICK